MEEKILQVKIVDPIDKFNWEPWVLLVALLSLIAAVIIPFAQKKYEEYRTKRNFQYYLKKQIGMVLNLLTTEKLEYIEPSVKNDPVKEWLDIKEFILKIRTDFKEHKHSVQPRVIFMLLMNVQRLCHYAYRLRLTISDIDLKNITEKTLEHGQELSKDELNKIYGLILIYESHIGISTFHDKFSEIKAIERLVENKIWVGLSVKKELLANQQILNNDLLVLNNNENSLEEIEKIVLLVAQETKKYFDYDTLQANRKKGSR
ncbi:MAG: hypothetical protein HY062_02725 [Bacteroidetes bacterium]|nr:hypothetical protein [Bacteroidota bacterium]